MVENPTASAWQTTRIALKWNCRTSHNKWRRVGDAVLARGFEQGADLTAGEQLIANHKNSGHRDKMTACLHEDPILFWDLVYKYWRARGPHDGLSRETINVDEFEADE
ncbi:MAG: hypothetical protein AAF581_00600 [Planctomycetota bacterium]